VSPKWSLIPNLKVLLQIAVVVAVLVQTNAVSVADDASVRTSVCQLSATPERYYGKFVIIVGTRVNGGTLGFVTLTDLHCEGLVVVRFSQSAQGRPEIKRMFEEFQRWDYTQGRPPIIIGDFAGNVEKDGFFNEVAPAVVVEYVENLSISQDPRP
jgi:hypothetical protein